MYHKEKNPIFELQKNTKNIRNFCILAHVDHGKTTLADTLLASNGIISTRMSGKLRYMDSRQDEQERGITMKSSAISLIHLDRSNNEQYLINLIDSPGHVDFSTEVNSAVRLCDGAAILIDVCEGICPQTHAVLRQASMENLKLVLILNKIDRLILELQMTPMEAYSHLMNILGQFNALVAQQFTSLICEKNDLLSDSELDENVEWADDIDESTLYFSPKYNNVFFASAIDGWGFGIQNFADIYSTKLSFKREVLIKTLWGDYYLNAKTKRIMKDAQKNSKKPLFVQFILESIWKIYESVYTRRDTVMTEKILESLKIKLAPRELKYTDPKGPLQALFINWLPLGKNLLDMIVMTLPSPLEMPNEKVEHLISNKLKPFKSLPKETQDLKKDFMNCSPNAERPVIVFVSKMFAAEKDSIIKKRQLTMEDIEQKREAIRLRKKQEEENRNNPELLQQIQIEEKKAVEPVEPEEEETKQEFLAFARIFSGTLKKGQTLFILSPKHNSEDFIGKNIDLNSSIEEIAAISKHVIKFTVNDIYLMMGRELELIDEVPCGNIVAIGSLENLVLKSATLSNTLYCPSFTSMYLQTSPIVRVAIEPKNPSKMKELTKGLRLLNQSDPCVEIYVQENGEHILCTAGEVHLQRCIDDLVQRFAMIPVNVSPPIIPFRETIIAQSAKDRKLIAETASHHQSNQQKYQQESDQTENAKDKTGPDGRIEIQSNDKRITIWVKAKPLPVELTKFLEDNVQILKLLNQNKSNLNNKESVDLLIEFKKKFNDILQSINTCSEDSFDWKSILNKIISFGPNKYGPNILVNLIGDEDTNVWAVLDNIISKNLCESLKTLELSPKTKNSTMFHEYENSLTFGFNLFTAKGPICEEPLQGVSILIEKFQIDEQLNDSLSNYCNVSVNSEDTEKKTSKVQTTQCISLMKEACKRAFEIQPQRLMVAMYKCEIMTVNSEALGKLYAVLGKRNAKILDETMKDGTSMFIIIAHIPVADSFGLAEEIRKRTSGLASPHIEFSHFENIEIDPYWDPKTEEELELFGDKADFENQARKYMNEVRKRKGLFVKEKIVEHSEKQRTLIKD